MCTVFWDRKGVLLVDFLPQVSTINAGVCCNTLKKLHRMIQNKRRVMCSWGVVMIHDNTHPHTAMQNLITTFRWEQFHHHPYSPDLVPSDFHLLLPCWPVVPQRQCVQRSCYHMFCIAGSSILRWRDPKTGAALWQVPQDLWKLCWKIVYSMYIKWQYAWFVIYCCFFLITHRDLLSG